MSADWDELLDCTKIAYHADRIAAWERGERIAPITIDMALTRTCNYGCRFCAAWYQENERKPITKEVMHAFLEDCAEIGVKGISLVSDGESTVSPAFEYSVLEGHRLGIDMAVGTNGLLVTREVAERILPALTYIRINFSAGEKDRYAEIMGVKPEWFDRVCQNIRDMVAVKREMGLKVTIGMQMVLMPEFADQILPFAALGKSLRPDYAVIKHCSDTKDGKLGVDYSKYAALEDALHEAESYSDEDYKCVVKWTKIRANGGRSYQRCYGPPFILQISGSGLVAPCGGLFNDRFRKFHIGNIVTERFKSIVQSDRYWEVVNYLASDQFDAQKTCDSLCLQHKTNEFLDAYKKGATIPIYQEKPEHASFI